MMQKIIIANFLSFVILSWGCANQVTPSGGEKDITPPIARKFIPENFSTFFSADKIEIEFDEYFQAADLFNQVVISPPLENAPDIKVKGKKLILKLNNVLRDSTTYTINFGESIKDITEGNVLENFTYVFSTGSYIDSLTMNGSVTDLMTGKPAEKVYAVLYPAKSDSLFSTGKPYYFAKTNANGKFQINNIKEGNYFLYAIEDQNFNFYYDLPNERIAFADSIIKIDSTIRSFALNLFAEDKIEQQFLSAKSYRYGQSRLAFSKNASDSKIEFAGEENKNSFFEKNKPGDTLYFWHPDIYLTKHVFRIQYDTIDTMLSVDVKSFPSDSNFSKNKNTLSSNAVPVTRGESASRLFTGWDLDKNIELVFSNPLNIFNADLCMLTEDTTNKIVFPEIKIDTLQKQRLTISYAWLPAKNYSLKINAGATKDIFGLTNDSASFYIQTKKTEDYGNVIFNISNTSPSDLILQFMKQDMTIIKEKFISRNTSEKLTYNYLLPAKYIFRVVKDENKNGRWDTGNLSEHKQPEQILFYPAEVTTKANWEVELKWVIE